MKFTGLTLITEPPEEPVTLTEVKSHCRIDIDDDDTYLTSLIKVARIQVENYLNRALVEQTWEVAYDRFPSVIMLPKPPLLSVDSITYVDTAGVTQTLAATEYQVDTRSKPGRVMPSYSKSWPTTYGYFPYIREDDPDFGFVRSEYFNAVVVQFTCGYTPVQDLTSPISSPPTYDYTVNIPQAIKQAILMLAGHLYENRESTAVVELKTVPMGFEMLLYPYRIFTF